MLPSSVRRVVSSAPQSPLVSSFIASAPRAAASITRARPGSHQRRCSSSKPSSPDNGAKDIPGQSVPASASSRSNDAKSNGEKRKRKSKDSTERDASSQRLPSVPSTQHLSQEALGLSTFFSLHRPISITHSLPKSVTEEAFAQIFNSRTRVNKVTDVISTISRTADELEGTMAKMTISNQPESDSAGEPIHKIDVKHPDGSESSVYVHLNSMSGQFLPFRPPPLPEPQSSASVQAQAEAAAEEAAEDTSPQHRVYRAMFTIEETTDSDGQVRVMAHSPQILQNEAPRTFLERMALRQMKFDEAQGQDGTMQALSVKRQRKLKMKKKKYKKLMKRTRNLRRKLDRM